MHCSAFIRNRKILVVTLLSGIGITTLLAGYFIISTTGTAFAFLSPTVITIDASFSDWGPTGTPTTGVIAL